MSTRSLSRAAGVAGLAALLAGLAAVPAGFGLVGAARGSAPPALAEAPALIEPFPFDHGVHAGAFEAARVVCSDCHPVGLSVPAEEGVVAPAAALPTPISSCHGCHRKELPRSPRASPSACGTCHADLSALVPTDHGPGWQTAHAIEARAFGASCLDCHDSAQCHDCHDERGPGVENPHPPAFRAGHGVDARLDPRSCTTCHTGESCLECHEGGGWPW